MQIVCTFTGKYKTVDGKKLLVTQAINSLSFQDNYLHSRKKERNDFSFYFAVLLTKI